MRVLVVDDEELARNDLSWLLNRSEAVCEVLCADSGEAALRLLNSRDDIDGLFLDIRMAGLDGVELARVLRNFRSPPPIAFVTAFDEFAVDAFDLAVCDYLLKPVDQARLEETLRRMRDRVAGSDPETDDRPFAQLTSRQGSEVFEIDRADVTVVEAAGDYVRLHTGGDSHLVRQSISSLTSAWSGAGFVRIHRSYLVRVSAITRFESVDGSLVIEVGGRRYPVSRRYSRLVRDHLSPTPD